MAKRSAPTKDKTTNPTETATMIMIFVCVSCWEEPEEEEGNGERSTGVVVFEEF